MKILLTDEMSTRLQKLSSIVDEHPNEIVERVLGDYLDGVLDGGELLGLEVLPMVFCTENAMRSTLAKVVAHEPLGDLRIAAYKTSEGFLVINDLDEPKDGWEPVFLGDCVSPSFT